MDCIRLAGNKAQKWCNRHDLKIDDLNGIILVSDAFLPFVDNVEVAALFNTQYILQPGGSIRDTEIEVACQLHNIKMIYSGLRTFTH